MGSGCNAAGLEGIRPEWLRHTVTFNQVETTERWRRGMAGIGAIEQTEQVVDEAS